MNKTLIILAVVLLLTTLFLAPQASAAAYPKGWCNCHSSCYYPHPFHSSSSCYDDDVWVVGGADG